MIASLSGYVQGHDASRSSRALLYYDLISLDAHIYVCSKEISGSSLNNIIDLSTIALLHRSELSV